ncbi:MAG: inositol monophosphatase family protein [Gemmatimonadaceae bacterium]
MSDARLLLDPIRRLHDRIRDAVVDACIAQSTDALATVDAEEASDTIYRIDRVSEEILIDGLAEVARGNPICLMAEGLSGGSVVLPAGANEGDCEWRILVDPIDGTRGIMYQKRSAWILTGVAPNHGAGTRLSEIEIAVQTEIPLVKQHLCDQLWAVKGEGAHAVRYNRLSRETTPIALRPSRAETIAHGFSSVSRFFPGVRDVLAEIDDEIVRATIGDAPAGKAACFEDQYLSTGGQLYELMAGHDRFIADIRPVVESVRAARGLPPGLCCHPYDLCSMLVAQELGVELTGASGGRLDAPFDLEANVGWVGYANAAIRASVEPALLGALRRRGLLDA